PAKYATRRRKDRPNQPGHHRSKYQCATTEAAAAADDHSERREILIILAGAFRRDNPHRARTRHRTAPPQSQTGPDRTALAEDRQFLFRLSSPVAAHNGRAAEHESVARTVGDVPLNRNRKLEHHGRSQ